MRLIAPRAVVALVVFGVAAYAMPDPAPGQVPSSDASPQVMALTQSLITMTQRYSVASAAERARLEGALVQTAATRFQLLRSIAETDPATVLASVLPANLRSTLPPSAASHLEQEAQLEGVLEILHEDSATGSKYHFSLTSTQGRYALYFAASPPAHLMTGAKIRVQGVQVGNVLALGSGDTSVQTIAAAVPNTFGAQKTLVILVNFQDAPTNQPFTVADVQSAFFTMTSNYWLENSYQQTWLTGDVAGWFTIAYNSTACDYSSIANLADSAATAAGYNGSAYTHHVYVFPNNSYCGWSGLSTIGGNPSRGWLNGFIDLMNTAHELGHGLGLYHSHSLDCDGTATIGSTCATNEYGDILDVMGASPSAHYNAFQKERLGWLGDSASPPITTVTTSGMYVIDVYETVGSGPKALKILKSTDPTTGAKTWYYVESRQAIGFDAFIANKTSQTVTNGVLIHVGTDGKGNSSDLLDMTPATPVYYWWYDPALAVGQSFNDPNAGVTITTQWVTATQAAVAVQVGSGTTQTSGTTTTSSPTQTVQPTVAVSTNQLSYTRPQTVAITATVTGNGSPVGGAAIAFSVTKPNGTVVTGSATTGSSGTAVFQLKLRKQDPTGTYKASASDTSIAPPATAAATFAVQ